MWKKTASQLGTWNAIDVGANLDSEAGSEQLRRYREGLPNLFLTDYLEFRWYYEGVLRESARLGRLRVL